MVKHLENLFIFIECSERLDSKEGPFVGLGADKIYRGRFPKEPEIYYFCHSPGGKAALCYFETIQNYSCTLQKMFAIWFGLHTLKSKKINKRIFRTSLESRMLSRSLSDCQSQTLNIRVQVSQFDRNSKLCH